MAIVGSINLPWARLWSGIVLILSLSQASARSGEPPVLTGVFPPGATVGRETVWTWTGENLDRVETLVVSGLGVEQVALRHESPTRLSTTVRVAADAVTDYREVRLDGPDGTSNAVCLRIDGLPQSVEVEPEAEPEYNVGTAIAGRLGTLDRDTFRFRGVPGERVALDLEVRRLGFTFTPVVTVTTVNGRAIAQGRESRGGDRDCRMAFAIPADGWFQVQVRDNLDRGGDLAVYRLRVEPAPPIVAPKPGDQGPTRRDFTPGSEVVGHLDDVSGVAGFELTTTAGTPIGVRVTMPPLSRLDPVVLILDAEGQILAEGDALLRYVPPRAEPVRIELADRFGGRGADFAYRLTAGPPRPDLRAEVSLEQSDVVHVRAGEEVRLNVAIVPDGFAGTVELAVKGLPKGCRSEPLTVRVSANSAPGRPLPVAALWIEVDREARPGLASFQVEATGISIQGENVSRVATVRVEHPAGLRHGPDADRGMLRVLPP